MPVLFEGVPGRVTAIQDPSVQGVLPPLIGLQPENINFSSQLSIITHVSLALATNHQFLHTLGNDIYIYVFGDRIGQMQIAGMCFAADCAALGCNSNGGSTGGGVDLEQGIEKMMSWYNNYKLSNNQNIVTIMLGHTPIDGFVTGVNFGTYDTKLRIMQFALDVAVVPEQDTSPASGD